MNWLLVPSIQREIASRGCQVRSSPATETTARRNGEKFFPCSA